MSSSSYDRSRVVKQVKMVSASSIEDYLIEAEISESKLLEEIDSEVKRIYTSDDITRVMKRFRRNKKVSDSMIEDLEGLIEARVAPSNELWKLLGKNVKKRQTDLENILSLLAPQRTFQFDKSLELETVKYQRQQMNDYWDKETSRFRSDMSKSIRESIRQDLSVEETATLIQARTGVSQSRSLLIARDQTLKAGARVSEMQQKRLGLTHFKWRTQRDDRVGEDHQVKDGKVYLWNSSVEKPGNASRPNCRCIALPHLID